MNLVQVRWGYVYPFPSAWRRFKANLGEDNPILGSWGEPDPALPLRSSDASMVRREDIMEVAHHPESHNVRRTVQFAAALLVVILVLLLWFGFSGIP